MFTSDTVLVLSREEIFVDCGQEQRCQDFCGWTEYEIGRLEVPWEVSLPGFGIGMINGDFHIVGI